MNKHTVTQFKKELDVLVKDAERLAFLLDAIMNKEYELITMSDGSWKTLSIEEIENILQKV